MKIKILVMKACLILLLTSLFIWIVKHSDNKLEYFTVKQNTGNYIIVDQLVSRFSKDKNQNIDNEINEVVETTETKDESNKPIIHIAPGKYSNYYHIRFTLTPENTVLTVPLSERTPKYSDNNNYEFAEGGQFEVFIEKEKFPILSPHSNRKYLILRMPYTDHDMKNAEKYIAEKFELFKKIGKLKNDPDASVEVSIELNPYINVLSEDPLKIELSGRNIFFRQAYGRYIDYVGKLRRN